MFSLQLQCFFVCLLCIAVQSKKICDFTDVECMTKGANSMFKTLTGGIEGVVETSDPMSRENMEGQVKDLKYKTWDITFSGMSDCKVTRLICRQQELTFDYFLQCPHLVLKSAYQTEGTLRSIAIDGKGVYALTADDYIIKYKGEYGKLIAEDQTPRVFIKSFDIETEPKGKLAIEIISFEEGEKAGTVKAIELLNQQPLELEKLFRPTVIEPFLKKFMTNLSKALQTFHLDELVPKEDD